MKKKFNLTRLSKRQDEITENEMDLANAGLNNKSDNNIENDTELCDCAKEQSYLIVGDLQTAIWWKSVRFCDCGTGLDSFLMFYGSQWG